MKLGYWKGSKTGNEKDKLKELKKNKSKLKRDIKLLKKRVLQRKDDDEGDGNEEPEYTGDEFVGNHYKKKSIKIN